MKNLKIKTIILGSTLLLSLSIMAQPGQSADCPRDKNNAGFHAKHTNNQLRNGEGKMWNLDLSDEQKTKIDALRLGHQKKVLPMQNELNEKRARMKTLETAENTDMKAINSLIDEMSVIKTKLAKERASMHQEIRKLLTEEQRIKFDMHQQNRGRKRTGGFGKN